MKAVVDSSVLISAFLTPTGAAGTLVAAGLKGRFEVYLSADILAETSRRLHDNRKLQERYVFTNDEVGRYVDRLAAAVPVLSDFPSITPVCRDPNDDHVLAAAVAAAADTIVTGDRDLLVLGTYETARIMTVREALNALD